MSDRTDEILQQLDEPIKVIDENSPEFLAKKKRVLLKLMAVSSGIDLAMFLPESLMFLGTMGGSLIMEEIVEYFISESINKYNVDTNIRAMDRIMGFIPIPGITALSIRCYKELKKVRKLEKKLDRS